MLGVFYPFVILVSVFSKRLRRYVSTFPVSYYLNWGSYVWFLMICILYHSYKSEFWVWSILVIYLLAKLHEEYKDLAQGKDFSEILKHKGKHLDAYFFDIWNGIDFIALFWMFVYMTFTLAYNLRYPYDWVYDEEDLQRNHFLVDWNYTDHQQNKTCYP